MNSRLLMLFVLHILNDGFRTTVITLLPFIAKDLALTLTQVGFLGSSQSLIGTFLAIPAGYVAAKLGGFKVLTVSLLLYALGFFGISSATNFGLIVPVFFLTALGFGCFHPVSFALVTRISDLKTRGKNMGNFMSVGDIGRLILPSVALFFVPSLGWRFMLAAFAAVGVGLFVLSQFLLRDTAKTTPTETQLAGRKRDWLKDALYMLKAGKFRNTMFSAIGDTLASSSIYTFLPFLLLSRGIGAAQLILFTSAFFFGSLAGKSVLGTAVDTHGNKRVFVMSELFMAGILILLVLLNHFFALILISFLLGVFTKGTSPVIQTMISESVHEDHYEKAFGASEMFIQIAAAAIVFIAGMVADSFGIHAVFYLAAFLAVMATLPILRYKEVNK